MSSVFAKYKAAIRKAKAEGVTLQQVENISGVPSQTIRSHLAHNKQPLLLNAEAVLNSLGYEVIIRKRRTV